MNIKLFLILMCFLIFTRSYAQDHAYSNFIQSPIYLNPALSGTSTGCDRMVLNYRNQYPAIKDAYAYYGVSYDRYVPEMNGGLAAMMQRSVEGEGFYTKNAFSVAYSFQGIRTNNLSISLGIQAGITNRSINYDKLIFFDQLDSKLGYLPGMPTAADNPVNNNKFYGDFATGFALVYKYSVLGASISHLSEPDESLISTESILPRKYNVHGSFNIPIASRKNFGDPAVIPAFTVVSQGKSSFATAGIQYRAYFFNFGAWYRAANIYQGGNSAIVSCTFDNYFTNDVKPSFSIGFAYDYTLSKIAQRNTGGAFEISLIYQSRKCSQNRNKIICPYF